MYTQLKLQNSLNRTLLKFPFPLFPLISFCHVKKIHFLKLKDHQSFLSHSNDHILAVF